MDVAGADAGAEADAGDVQAQALGGFQIAAFEAGEKETPGGALFGQGDGGSVGGFLAGAGAADNDADCQVNDVAARSRSRSRQR